jgi:eukaryotic-like serine/threonine-protein kinase
MSRRVGDREGPELDPADATVRPERWTQIKILLDEALELSPAERESWLLTATAGDAELTAEVAAMLRLETEMGDFLEQPMFDLHAPQDGGGRSGETVGPYRLRHEIGRGGMGVVYLAERDDEEYRKTVAVKVLKRGLDTDEVIGRFRTERQILAGLEHPNIARLIEGGTTTADHLPYFVLEHVEGRPIDLYCDEEELDIEERLRLFLVVCTAVAAAHRNLVVHRDLKPSNILVTADGTPKLLDFGIAKLLGPAEADVPLTREGRFLLTPEYASPEQVWGQPVNTTTDVYSLGVLLFQLVTGRRPFEFPDPDLHAVARRLREEAAPRPSAVVPRDLSRRLAGDLDDIVGMALRKEPDRRYGSVEALAEDVRRHLAGLPVRAAPDSLAYRSGKFVRRHRAGVAAAAVIAALVVGFALVATVLMQDAVRERETAERVTSFLENLFAEADPGRSWGEETSVREVLDAGAEHLAGGLDGEPEVKARLLHTVGIAYLGLGLEEAARPLIEVSHGLRRELYGPRSIPVAESLYLLAKADLMSRDLKSAEARIEEALHIQRELGALDDNYLHGLGNLAVIKTHRRDHEGAVAIQRENLRVKRRRFAADDPEIANTLHNLATALHRQGEIAEALTHFGAALAIRRGAGISPLELAATLNSYGSALEEAGDLASAEARYQEALDIRRRIYKDGHRELAYSLNNTALLLLARGDLPRAESYLRDAMPMMRQGVEEHAVVLRNLAAVLTRRGAFAEAEATIDQSIEILRSQDDTPAWRITDAQSVRGGVLARIGRTAEAESLLLAAYLFLVEEQGAHRRPTRESLERIIDLYTLTGDEERAASYRRLRQPPPGIAAAAAERSFAG